MSADKPSLELLRSITDEHVLRALMDRRRMTRAEIAVHTGISKTTISESVRRLSESGLLVDTGERTTGRGRVGSYYALAGDIAIALVVSISPRGVVGEAVDVFGEVVGRAESHLGRAAGRDRAARTLAEVARAVRGQVGGGLRTAVVSAADPVDRGTGRLVHLPDAPFLVGDLDPVAVLGSLVEGPVLVDNDVNWAARAEGREGCAAGVADFVYVHLGEGLGCAVVSDGEIRRGHRGLAGEIAHLLTAGPDGAAVPLTEVFAVLGLRRQGSTAIDVEALRAATAGDGVEAVRTRGTLARAVGGVLAAAVSLSDPQLVVIGGTWGLDPGMIATIAEHFGSSPRSVPVTAALVPAPDLAGARIRAVEELQSILTSSARPGPS
ncbi:ROK family transcriptional regulator [Streptosporangium sp. 'caverna']|uniref:ROK family transcriptional regulator n=1 Tax=Streptosporangium sp. 'caverna' TaxID=2202249 RepID=UPI000D7D839D|nr:ROK family transcriptional regulator [Streptosporangium sp. 'caverna']AWS43884.1 ROK family transcriptional regulator [Streptosporangium sp. 'caverna']